MSIKETFYLLIHVTITLNWQMCWHATNELRCGALDLCRQLICSSPNSNWNRILHQSSILRTSSRTKKPVHHALTRRPFPSYLVPLFKRVLVENLSDRDNLNLRENELVGAAYFHINGFFTQRLVWKQRQDAALKWPCLLTCTPCLADVILLPYDTSDTSWLFRSICPFPQLPGGGSLFFPPSRG